MKHEKSIILKILYYFIKMAEIAVTVVRILNIIAA